MYNGFVEETQGCLAEVTKGATQQSQFHIGYPDVVLQVLVTAEV
jgi:hypothetical protein